MMKYQKIGGVVLLAGLLSVGCLPGNDLSAKADVNFIGGKGLIVDEDGAKEILRLSLSFAPTSNVVLRFESSDVGEVLLGRGIEEDEVPNDIVDVTFTPDNWSDIQKVIFYGQDDDFVDDKQLVTVITHLALSDDSRFNGLNPKDFQITVEDNDTPGITLLDATDLTVTESGGTASFFILLNSEPTNDVAFSIRVNDPSEGLISKDNDQEIASTKIDLVFEKLEWDIPQKIVVFGQDDNIVDGNMSFIVETLPTVSEDKDYKNINLQDVTVRNEDDDVAALAISASLPLIVHAANSETSQFTIVLTASPRPNQNASITITTSDASLSKLQREDSGVEFKDFVTVVFTPEDWNIPKTIFIEGVDDSQENGVRSFFIRFSPSKSRDRNFVGMRHPDLEVFSFDLKPAIFTYPTEDILISESGGTGEFVARLTSEPLNPVSLTFRSDQPAEGLLSQTGAVDERLEQIDLSFTPENWSSLQVVTVHGVDDTELVEADRLDGNQFINIIAGPSLSADDDYNGVELDNISALNIDNDQPNITITPSTSLETTDSGAIAFFYVVLNSEPEFEPATDSESVPIAEVVLNVQTSKSSEGLVSKLLGETPKFKIPLTFTLDNWSIPQIVYVQGVRDGEVDGDQIYEITVEVDTVETLASTGYLEAEKSVVSISSIDDT